MKTADVFVLLFSGLAFFAGLGVLLSRRMVMMALSLGLFFLAVAGIFAGSHLEAAFFTQLVLYIGGVMVLIGFALHLYPETSGKVPLGKVRESPGKGLLLFIIMALCLFFAPWESIRNLQTGSGEEFNLKQDYGLRNAGRHFLLDFPFEFEWIGVLMLTALLTAGWFLKEIFSPDKK
jgi:NADH:ubiquinone oxidoreductase subunit 6 (subunit J)